MRRQSRWLGPAFLVWTLAAGVAGCGDDSASGGGTTASGGGPSSGGGDAGGPAGGGGSGAETPTVLLPRTAIGQSELGVLVNDMDPQSVAVGDYYVSARGIPEANVVHVSFPVTGSDNIASADFTALKTTIDATTPANVEAFAVTWTTPTRVDCMSLTTALAYGFSTDFCNTTGGGCGPTAPSDYFDDDSTQPFTDLGVRPAMVLPGTSLDDVKALIDRGVAADDTFPGGQGWFVRTTDEARSVRWPNFLTTIDEWTHDGGLAITYLDNAGGGGLDYIENQFDILFYLTGLAAVPAVATNTYLPGAVADHLTSYGGSIPASGQMSVLEWIQAGVTASYGTLQEPCNYEQKFPRADVLLTHYFRGETILEAYWKSVQWPGEGLFVGEPLARPWGTTVAFDPATLTLTITTTILQPDKIYELRASDSESGPFAVVLADIATADYRSQTIVLENATAPFYELVEVR